MVVVVDLIDRDCRRWREMILLLFFFDASMAYTLRWRRLLRRMS
jgi:hypothetical protein